MDWKRCAMADYGARWYGTIVKNYKIRMTSMPEKLREPDLAKERLAGGAKPQPRRKSEQDQNAHNKPAEATTRATRDQTAGIWTLPPVRKLCQNGGFAALGDSAIVAGWLAPLEATMTSKTNSC